MNAKQKTINHFNETASYYNDSGDGKFVEPMYDALMDEILKLPQGKILDVGCGNGNLFSMIPDDGYELVGVDFSVNMIDEAIKKCGDRASFLFADAESLPFAADEFDMVVCNASFHHYIHPEAVLGQMHRVLKDGGKLLIGDPYVPGIIRPVMNVLTRFSKKGDYHFYGTGEMERLFSQNGFAQVSNMKTGDRTILYIAEKI